MRISDWSSDVCSSDLYDRLFCSVKEFKGGRKGQVAVNHDAQGVSSAPVPDSELRVIGKRSAVTYHHGVFFASPAMHQATGKGRGDPITGTIQRGDRKSGV